MSDTSATRENDLSERLRKLSPEKRALLELMSSRKSVTGHQLIARSLRANGVTHIFSISGVPVQETLAAAVEAGIRVIGTRHQQAAVMMAVSHNYVAGKTCAVSVVSAGPAATNVATGLLVAKDNSWPLVVLGGCRQGDVGGQEVFQELDAAELYKPITKLARMITTIDEIPDAINKAFEIAVSGRPGPVYLDIREDALRAKCIDRSEDGMRFPRPAVCANPDQISQACEMLTHARQPAVILGRGLRWGLQPDDLAGLIEQNHIAFITSPMGRGVLPDDHPLCFNRAKQQLQATADVVLVLGARLNWTFRFGSQINPHAKIIQVDIDPEELKRNEKVHLGIAADAGAFVGSLLAALHSPTGTEQLASRKRWHASLAPIREKQRKTIEERALSDRLPMSTYRLMKELKASMPEEAILVADGNVSMMAVQHVIPGLIPFSRLTAGTDGCMGTGVPFGIGARLAEPSRPVIVVTGDMAFGICAMELETAVRCSVPVIVVVVNNEGISGGDRERELYPAGHERVTMFEPGIRYERIAEAFGAHGEYIEHPGQIRAAIDRAIKSGKPACINVKVAPYEKFISEL